MDIRHLLRVIDGGRSMALEKCDCAACQRAAGILATPPQPVSADEADARHRAWMAKRAQWREANPIVPADVIAQREIEIAARANRSGHKDSFERLLGADGRP